MVRATLPDCPVSDVSLRPKTLLSLELPPISYTVLLKDYGSQIWWVDVHVELNCADHQEPEDLFETISQTLLNSVDRDALSGWGAVVRIM